MTRHVLETAATITTLWAAPGDGIETQLLLGEPVLVLEDGPVWCRVVALWQDHHDHPDGYPGWVRAADLTEPVARRSGPTAYVRTRRATGTPGLDVLLGTVLWAADDDHDAHDDHDDKGPHQGPDQVSVLLPGSRAGRLRREDLSLSVKAEPPSYDAEAALRTARLLTGTPYLWGGLGPGGIDCSGLVHLAWRCQGVLLPRNADDQSAPGVEEVPLDRVRPGDLYFFAEPGRPVGHVGFVTRPPGEDGSRWLLHADSAAGVVEGPLPPGRAATLVSAGRVVG